jgi:hypothetical protein
MEKKFVKLPSGMIINMERVSLIGRVSAVKETPRSKPKEWTLTIQFINEDVPSTFHYDKETCFNPEQDARADYNALCQACESINNNQP